MIGSHTATTFSMRSQAAATPPESTVKAAASAGSLRGFIARLPLRLRWDQKSSSGPVDEQLLDHEEQKIGAIAHRAGDQDRAVHVGELIGDLGIDGLRRAALNRHKANTRAASAHQECNLPARLLATDVY